MFENLVCYFWSRLIPEGDTDVYRSGGSGCVRGGLPMLPGR